MRLQIGGWRLAHGGQAASPFPEARQLRPPVWPRHQHEFSRRHLETGPANADVL